MYAFAGLTCRCLDFRQTKLSSSETRGYADDQVSFDASLGFPGEGPLNSPRGFNNFWQMSCSQWISPWISSWGSVFVWGCSLPAARAMPIFPRTVGEKVKASQRRLLPPVPQGRPVLPITRKRGASLLDEFFVRAFEEGLDMIGMFEKHHI